MPLSLLKPLVSLCKRRGFIFPGSDIYDGFANTYSYGHYGCLLKKKIKDLWWHRFVQMREDIVGLDSPILLHPEVWRSSGHVEGFHDLLVDCKSCRHRYRLDHLLEEKGIDFTLEGMTLEEIEKAWKDVDVACCHCGKKEFTQARMFNLMFQTSFSKNDPSKNLAYLRPETAQGIFVDYQQVLTCMRKKPPFGIAQIGKAFRNEITPGRFTFRMIEFEQMEIEFFIHPETWEKNFSLWLDEMTTWCDLIGLRSYRPFEIPKERLPHYSLKNVDMMFEFPFGTSELYGLAYRSDHDLLSHSKATKKDFSFLCPKTGERYIPHVIEPSFGLDRTVLAILCEAYEEEKVGEGNLRTVLRLQPWIAPIQCAFFPLIGSDEELKNKARQLYGNCLARWSVEYDEKGAIGKRYRRQDELGTPFCVTIDSDSLEDHRVTVRFRDSMEQVRIGEQELIPFLEKELAPKDSI
ncbi:glycine--tRNA ligase [Candidatus Similichlamydia laticola]|uniref:glycine--tRNA ligase n=1 Tax=Candidatus Similichlamydia laticola TaxID=2170265 RepID=A0A369KD74_9BACT|nr:glycine--tRNA ligase [Candidatus Similichlamydia laticola]RDB31552.1 Glycyl-tRNA synthetase [Candidatus Similichlamydia laticola]